MIPPVAGEGHGGPANPAVGKIYHSPKTWRRWQVVLVAAAAVVVVQDGPAQGGVWGIGELWGAGVVVGIGVPGRGGAGGHRR